LLTATGSAVDIGGEIPLNGSVRNAVAQLESSNLASNAGTEFSGLSLSSPTFNAVPSAGSDASAETDASSPPDLSREDETNVSLNIGAAGPALKIVNGGVRLPDHLVKVYE